MDRIRASRSWMWATLGLVLLVGVSVGVIADRTVIDERLDGQQHHRPRTPLSFSCVEGDDDLESHAAYPYQEGHRGHLKDRLSGELGLRSEQVDELVDLLERRREQTRIFWGAARHDYCEMKAGFRADIRALLDDEQQVAYDDLLERVDARERERWSSGGRHDNNHPEKRKESPTIR